MSDTREGWPQKCERMLLYILDRWRETFQDDPEREGISAADFLDEVSYLFEREGFTREVER